MNRSLPGRQLVVVFLGSIIRRQRLCLKRNTFVLSNTRRQRLSSILEVNNERSRLKRNAPPLLCPRPSCLDSLSPPCPAYYGIYHKTYLYLSLSLSLSFSSYIYIYIYMYIYIYIHTHIILTATPRPGSPAPRSASICIAVRGIRKTRCASKEA